MGLRELSIWQIVALPEMGTATECPTWQPRERSVEWLTMKAGEIWFIDAADHFEHGTNAAWTDISSLDMQTPLVRFVGYIVKVNKDSVAMAVNVSDDQCTTPFSVLKSAIINSGKIALPPKRRKPAV